ncbi:PaaI family thioesterase [Frigidibacter sp.]|uniref:PaaI family thioesterase n=1 Tax=Frigidibacter sp. TaxID=2586418 RepID=UPI0027343A5D|nr:PaaI family thioesterase [Frigidibacter sp.]MDP3338819.1 PaaI family thioesterase [Frigidibacter sp.]
MDEGTKARVRASFAKQSLMETFGASLDALAPGSCTITAPIGANARQQHGVGHAGLTFALGDTAAGYAALTAMPEGAEVMTVEMKINLMAPAAGARLIATGRVVKAGRRLTVVTAEVEAETEAGARRTVALLQGTMIAVDPAG